MDGVISAPDARRNSRSGLQVPLGRTKSVAKVETFQYRKLSSIPAMSQVKQPSRLPILH
jgi:hypothetical protein